MSRRESLFNTALFSKPLFNKRSRQRPFASLLSVALAAIALGGGARLAAQEPARREDPAREQGFKNLAQEVQHLERESDVLKKVAKLVRPSVVHIDAESTSKASDSSGRKIHVDDTGSGFLVEMGGKDYVITNRHVIKYAGLKEIKIKLDDGREFHPTKTWSDPDTDIAVMSLSAEGLTPARVGDSSKLEIGDFILAVGSPFGLSHSVTFGIVSATGRRDLENLESDIHYQDFLQIDAAINPGNSGGPLINLHGEVVGVNTAIATTTGWSDGVGFSIPINMVMTIAKQLVENGTVKRAYLGVSLDRRFGAAAAAEVGLKTPYGTRITGITPNSPAETAHLKVGDIVLEFDGVRVEGDSHLPGMVSLSPVGKETSLRILRDKKEMTVMVTLGPAPTNKVAK